MSRWISLSLSGLYRCWSAWASSRRSTFGYWLSILAVFLFVLSRSLVDSWDFPWYGNPDQDLVFLRDGFRLLNGGVPGYGDHPGLIQMLIAAFAIFLLKLLPGLAGDSWIDGSAISDADWQYIFAMAKAVNVFFMAVVLSLCVVLAMRWLGRGWGLLWGLMSAASMGSVSEIYQLRNEFYSSFLVILGVLVAAWASAPGLGRGSGKLHVAAQPALRALLCSLVSYVLLCLGLLAKVQVLPVLFATLLALFVIIWRYHGFLGARVFVVALGMVVGAVLIGAAGYFHGLGISISQSFGVLFLLASPSAFVLSCVWLQSAKAFPVRFRGLWLVLIGSGFAGLTSLLLRLFGFKEWLLLLSRPLSVRSYAVAANQCLDGQLVCALRDGLSGYRYLFERSIDSYALAPIVGVSVVIGGGVVVVELLRRAGLRVSWRHDEGWVGLFCGVVCLAVACVMAFLAGQRWAVDHYLSYQQPFLFAALILFASGKAPAVRVWRPLLALTLVSVLLIFLRYPEGSRRTYVKENIDVAPVAGRGDGSLCAPQHAGTEWKGSSLWRLCDGFEASF